MAWEIRHAECCEEMAAMPAGSVDAIVTSPPYADQRNYAGGNEQRTTERNNRNGRKPGSKNQSRKQRSAAPMKFAAEFCERPLSEMHRVLGSDGSLMLNLGVVMRDGEESPYADVILAAAREMGFKLLHRIVWHKPNGNTLSDPRFLRVSHEWCFWLAKSTGAYRGYDRETRTPHAPSSLRRMHTPFKRDPNDERYAKRSETNKLHPEGAKPMTVFQCAVGGERGIKHPAVMPLKLARHLVALSAGPGAKVLDPYAGSCTTGVACVQLGREFIGLEREAGYLPEGRARLEAARFSPTIAREQMALDLGADAA